MLNFDKIKELNIKKNNIKLDTYKNILLIVLKTIESKALNGENFCLYEVPEFIFGEINYDIKDCSNYIVDKLKDEQYIIDTTYYEPNIIYIKWSLNV
jgi:hypothetical protein